MILATYVQRMTCPITSAMVRANVIWALAIPVFVIGCEKPQPGGQPPLPSQLRELVLYDVSGLKEVTDGELGTITHYHVPAKTTKMIFRQTRYKNHIFLCEGSCLGVAATEDGAQCRVAFSYHGGFFKILGYEGYFQTLGPSRRELDLLIERVATQTFIPARKAAQTQSATTDAAHP
jgi:hypothetical protein